MDQKELQLYEQRFASLSTDLQKLHTQKAVAEERRKTLQGDLASVLEELKALGIDTPEQANTKLTELQNVFVENMLKTEQQVRELQGKLK